MYVFLYPINQPTQQKEYIMQKHNLKLVSDAVAIAKEAKEKHKIKKGLTLKKRSDGRSPYWFVHVTIAKNGTKIISTGTSNLTDAIASAYEIEATLKADVSAGISINSKSFERVADEYMDWQKQRLLDGEIAQSSYERMHKTITNYLMPFFAEKKITIAKVSRLVLNDFRTWLPANRKKTDGRMGTATRRKYEDILGALIKWAESKGYIKELPRFDKTRVVKNERPSFTKDQFTKMMRKLKEYIEIAPNRRDENIRQMMYYALALLSKTGLRPHELLPMPYKVDGKVQQSKGLKWQNVEFFKDNKTGKHSVDLYVLPTIDKNRQGRTVPADKSAYFILSTLYAQANETKRKIGYVFDTDYRSAFPRFLEWADMRTAKNGNNYTFYSLRHTYITWHCEDKPTSNPSQLAKVCGNSSATIEKYYDKSEIKHFRHNFI